MTRLKAFLSFTLGAMLGFGAAILTGMFPLSLLLLPMSTVLFAGLALYFRKHLFRSIALWGAVIGYISYIGVLAVLLYELSWWYDMTRPPA